MGNPENPMVSREEQHQSSTEQSVSGPQFFVTFVWKFVLFRISGALHISIEVFYIWAGMILLHTLAVGIFVFLGTSMGIFPVFPVLVKNTATWALKKHLVI